MNSKIYLTKTDSETMAIAREFAQALKIGDVVCLYGDLGFGKTTFTKGIAEGLGISTRIISPTFTIVRDHGGLKHIDLYRIESERQLSELGLKEILGDVNSVKIIEWAEKAHDLLPKKRWEVKFELGAQENERKITIYEQK